MDNVLSVVSFLILLVLIVVIVYMFIKLMQLSVKLNDMKYFAQRPQIPFQESKNFPYAVQTPAKNLI